MLIQSPKHTSADLAAWERVERFDHVLAQAPKLARLEAQARAEIRAFAAQGVGYVGNSWGKDSLVVARMAIEEAPQMPLVWIRVEPIANPDCVAVRDAFLRQYPQARYDEIEVWCRQDEKGWHATGTLEEGFALAVARYGDRYISGVRAEESGARKLRMMSLGVASARTCAPIGWWRGEDVFAFLHKHDLPIHPAYAMTFGGMTERSRVRVASIGCERGTGKGRRDWERYYYREVTERLEAGA